MADRQRALDVTAGWSNPARLSSADCCQKRTNRPSSVVSSRPLGCICFGMLAYFVPCESSRPKYRRNYLGGSQHISPASYLHQHLLLLPANHCQDDVGSELVPCTDYHLVWVPVIKGTSPIPTIMSHYISLTPLGLASALEMSQYMSLRG